MAMTPSGLSAMIKSEIESKFGSPTSIPELQNFCDAMGAAIVDYIQASAEVSVQTPGAFAGGATLPGTGSVS